jgi:hypothetical protein
MAREQVTTVPRRQARGDIACAPAAGRVSDPSTEVQTPARAQRGTPAPVPRARARTTRHARTCNGATVE